MRLSRPVVMAIWMLGVPLVHGALPVGLSRLGEQHGWSGGIVAVVAGAIGLAWATLLHVRSAPRETEVGWRASYFLDRGPYAYSRNPMYVAEIVLWIGWAVWFGSIAVTAGLALLWIGIAVVVRSEERMLERQLGDAYTAYRARVPRWF